MALGSFGHVGEFASLFFGPIDLILSNEQVNTTHNQDMQTQRDREREREKHTNMEASTRSICAIEYEANCDVVLRGENSCFGVAAAGVVALVAASDAGVGVINTTLAEAFREMVERALVLSGVDEVVVDDDDDVSVAAPSNMRRVLASRPSAYDGILVSMWCFFGVPNRSIKPLIACRALEAEPVVCARARRVGVDATRSESNGALFSSLWFE
jgi:hypothetical protein